MSTSSPQSSAASQQTGLQAALAQQLSGVALPELKQMLGQQGLGGMLSGRDSSGMMAADRQNYDQSLSQLNQGYGQAQNTSRESIAYGGLRSGLGRTNSGAVGSAITQAATGLERDQAQAQRQLQFMSAQNSMQDYNKVLQLLGQGTNTALGLAGGYAGAAGGAIGGMSGVSPFSSMMGGAASGASLGSAAGPYGALAGGVIGGAAGYFGGGG